MEQRPDQQPIVDVPAPHDEGMTLMEASALRHLVHAVDSFLHSPRQWWLAHRAARVGVAEMVGVDGTTPVDQGDQLSYADYAVERSLIRSAQPNQDRR